MAQLLKDELREAIISSGKEEFLKYGYEEASMRRIAAKANMTVGNLYHYFKNKEEINNSIVSPAINKINSELKRITRETIDFSSLSFRLNFSKINISKAVEELSNKLADIYFEDKDVFRIMLFHSKSCDSLLLWFTRLVEYLISVTYGKLAKKQKIFAKAISVGMMDGIKIFFKDDSIEQENLKTMLRIYIQAYLSMLDGKKVVGE